jgi:NADPH:quinone reductase-like Zn-dependent oxidoreductase
MRALVRDTYGSPDVLRVEEVDVPPVGAEDVLVRVVAASLNASDVEILRGDAFVRFGGPFRPRQRILGSDVAGVVEAVGAAVTGLSVGDEVVGDTMASDRFGAFAELAVAPARALVRKPASVSFVDAATLPQAAMLALQALRYHHRAAAGERVLLNGAGGGVGTFAVQLARSFGAEVTAVDGPAKVDRLRALGASHVLDHTAGDVTRRAGPSDRVVDVVARRSVLAWRRALRPGGIYLVIGGSAARIVQVALVGSVVSLAGSRTMRLLVARLGDTAYLTTLLRLVEDGTIRPVVDEVVGLDEAPAAFGRLMAGEVFGKVVLTP